MHTISYLEKKKKAKKILIKYILFSNKPWWDEGETDYWKITNFVVIIDNREVERDIQF